MNRRTEWHEAADRAYRERIRGNTLSELEDVFAHLDRGLYPARFEMVREEIEKRLQDMESTGYTPEKPTAGPAGLFRRLWASVVDLFVAVLLLTSLVLLGRSAVDLVQSFEQKDTQPSYAAPRSSPVQKFLVGVINGDPAAWKDTARWGQVGLWVLGFLVFRALMAVSMWMRSGSTPGMREAGIRMESADGGPVSFSRAAVRFWGHCAVFVCTVGLGVLWMLRNSERRTLADHLAGTRVVRVPRSWEKPPEARRYD